MWEVTSSATHIPSVPEIYAIGQDETIFGLEESAFTCILGKQTILIVVLCSIC